MVLDLAVLLHGGMGAFLTRGVLWVSPVAKLAVRCVGYLPNMYHIPGTVFREPQDDEGIRHGVVGVFRTGKGQAPASITNSFVTPSLGIHDSMQAAVADSHR